jgi:hypothetical protein
MQRHGDAKKKAGTRINAKAPRRKDAKTQRRKDAKKEGLNRNLLPITMFFPSLRLCDSALDRSFQSGWVDSTINAKTQRRGGAKKAGLNKTCWRYAPLFALRDLQFCSEAELSKTLQTEVLWQPVRYPVNAGGNQTLSEVDHQPEPQPGSAQVG